MYSNPDTVCVPRSNIYTVIQYPVQRYIDLSTPLRQDDVLQHEQTLCRNSIFPTAVDLINKVLHSSLTQTFDPQSLAALVVLLLCTFSHFVISYCNQFLHQLTKTNLLSLKNLLRNKAVPDSDSSHLVGYSNNCTKTRTKQAQDYVYYMKFQYCYSGLSSCSPWQYILTSGGL